MKILNILYKLYYNLRDWIKDIISVGKIHYISLIFILLIYVMLWKVPQIKDLLIIINQEKYHFIQMGLFFTSLTVLAFLISSLNDYISNTKHRTKVNNSIKTLESYAKKSLDRKQLYFHDNNDHKIITFKETQREYIERMFPKVLGTLLIVIVAFGINHTYYDITKEFIFFKNWSFFKSNSSIGFNISIILLFLILNQKVSIFIGKILKRIDKHRVLPIILGVCCLIIIIALGFINKKGTEGDIKNLFISTFLLAIFFFLVTTSYNKTILKFKLKIGNIIIVLFTVIVIISYVTFFIKPQLTNHINPLSIIFINFITFFTVINGLRILGKLFNVSLVTRTLIVLVFFGTCTASKSNFNHYNVSTVDTNHKLNNRLTIEDYTRKWLHERSNYIKQSKKFPVIFVSSEGGGSRAGLWSFLVHSYLYEKDPNYFNRNLFSLTGASGGGVGNSMFYTTANQFTKQQKKLSLYNTKANEYPEFKYKASVIYSGNYISSSVAAVMGRDLFKSITNFGTFKDRGRLVENEWERKYKSVFNNNYIGNEYLSIMPHSTVNSNVMPILMMNTTHLQSGQRFIVSPVKFTENKFMAGFRDFLAEYEVHNKPTTKGKNQQAIKISTSMLLNARFPYLSPVGKVPGLGQFGDAGYYDNIGGAVTRNLDAVFREVLNEKEFDSIRDRVSIRHLVIANHEKKSPSVLNGTQLSAPLKMILGATFSHPIELKKTYSKYLILSKRTNIIIKNDTIKPILPLGRILSKNGILSLEKRLENGIVKRKLDSLLLYE